MYILWTLSIVFFTLVSCAPLEDEVFQEGIPIDIIMRARSLKMLQGNF